MTDYERIPIPSERWYFRAPLRRFVGNPPKYFWNERCLKAPVPYMENGIYAMPPWRKFVPGLLSAPEPMPVPSPNQIKRLMDAYKNLLKMNMSSVERLLVGSI